MGLGIAALVLGFLALLLTWHWSRMTTDLIRSEDARAKELIDEGNKRAEQGKKETQRMIEEGNRRVEKLIEKMEDTQRYIASLISAEASKTRELIKTP